jgi:hypothetical protein
MTAKGEPSEAGDHLEAERDRGDLVAVAHPHGSPMPERRPALQQRRLALDLDSRRGRTRGRGRSPRAAQLRAHGHLAVADAEHRHAELEDPLRRRGAVVLRGRSRGPPDRITALGAKASSIGSTLSNGWISQ